LLQKDKISPRGAPSLLTPAQQAEANRNRILSTLEATDGARKRAPTTVPAAASAAPVTRSPWVRGLSAFALAAVACGVGVWYGQSGAPIVPTIANASPALASDPATPVVASTNLASTSAPVEAAATIQDEGGAQLESGAGESLSEVLHPDATPTAVAAGETSAGENGDMLSQALEAPSGAALAAAAAAPVALKVASTTTPKATPKTAQAKPKPAPKRATPRQAKPAAAPDTDAILLSALIAHAHAADAAPKKARPSLEQELGLCRKKPKIQQAACRERACDGRNAGLCKVDR